jgi:hypothetical protein
VATSEIRNPRSSPHFPSLYHLGERDRALLDSQLSVAL